MEIRTELLGYIGCVYEFRGMADFQFLPIRRRETDGTFEDLLPKLAPPDIPAALEWFDGQPNQNFESDGPLILPPFAFSRFLFPSPYIMSKEVEHREKNIQKKSARKDVIGLSKKVSGFHSTKLQARVSELLCQKHTLYSVA